MDQEEYINHISKSTVFGPGGWLCLHTLALRANDSKTKEYFTWFVDNFIKHGIFCSTCHRHANDYLMNNPLPKTPYYINSRDKRDLSMFKWTVDFHNAVNYRLGKPQVDIAEALVIHDRSNSLMCTSNCGDEGIQSLPSTTMGDSQQRLHIVASNTPFIRGRMQNMKRK